MQSVGGNLLQDLGNHADFNGKGKRNIFTSFLRARREDGIQSVFSVPAKKLSIHANVSQEEVGWICISF